MYNLNKNTIRTFEPNKSEVIWTVRYHLYPRFGVPAPGALRAICRTLRGLRNNGTPSNWPGRLFSLKGHLKVICFWFLEISITLFSLHAQMETGIPICHGRERSTEEAMETAERHGCLTIKLAIIAMIRSSLMGLSEQTILSADSQDRVDLRTTGHHQALITRKIRHSAIESNQILYNALHWKDNVAINEPAESVRLHKLICYCHESLLLQF